ncbi:Mitochondrial matrix cochaperone [Tulasnella sp. 427]|nr:Mitochondrial matrix cochaperone [Tulasnella sp. 427]
MSSSFSVATRLLRSCPTTLRTSQYRLAASTSGRLSKRFYSATADQAAPADDAKPPPPASESAETDLDAKLKQKDADIAELNSRLKYAQADFVNLQKISAREKEQTSLYAISNFARDLIGTVDVLGLALKSVPAGALSESSSDAGKHLKNLHEGVTMTQRELLKTLGKYGVTPFDPTGETFDPNHHEALYEAPIPGKEPGTVIDCQKVGYKIKERTLRAAQVGVAR